jgi:putative addiction module component (TIGR02574 family)
MSALTILIIRHAEKPGESWPGSGLTPDGIIDKKSLVIRGWQRAGSRSALFGVGLEPRPHRSDFHQLRDGPLYGTLIDMIKETIPELKKLSTADKFALAIELWDELSSNPDEIPVTEEQLNELDRRFEDIAMIQIKSSPGKRRRQGSFPAGVNGGCPSSLCRTGSSRGV